MRRHQAETQENNPTASADNSFVAFHGDGKKYLARISHLRSHHDWELIWASGGWCWGAMFFMIFIKMVRDKAIKILDLLFSYLFSWILGKIWEVRVKHSWLIIVSNPNILSQSIFSHFILNKSNLQLLHSLFILSCALMSKAKCFVVFLKCVFWSILVIWVLECSHHGF